MSIHSRFFHRFRSRIDGVVTEQPKSEHIIIVRTELLILNFLSYFTSTTNDLAWGLRLYRHLVFGSHSVPRDQIIAYTATNHYTTKGLMNVPNSYIVLRNRRRLWAANFMANMDPNTERATHNREEYCGNRGMFKYYGFINCPNCCYWTTGNSHMTVKY